MLYTVAILVVGCCCRCTIFTQELAALAHVPCVLSDSAAQELDADGQLDAARKRAASEAAFQAYATAHLAALAAACDAEALAAVAATLRKRRKALASQPASVRCRPLCLDCAKSFDLPTRCLPAAVLGCAASALDLPRALGSCPCQVLVR